MPKLMLVEDDNNLREIYEARLQAEGFTIVTAEDGEKALVVAKAEQPDLVISDVMMPKISGFEMLDILRNTEGLKDVKVIMLTALGQSEDQSRADKLGADRYLVKSQVTLEDIVKAAHELLGDSGAAAPAAGTPAPEPATTPAPEPTSDTGAAIPVAEPPAPADPVPVAIAAPSEPSTPAATQINVVDAPEPVAELPATDQADKEDDKLMSDAVETLVASTPAAAASAPEPTAQAEEPAAAPEAKVVEPAVAEAKKDLNVLVAEEEAKEQAAEANKTDQTGNKEDKPTDKPAADQVDPTIVAL